MYNKKRSPFDPSLEDVSSADPWIWGNQRGGGGAPLRDMDGNHLANLKKVLHGEVDVDHSPVSATKGASTVRRLSPRGRGDGYDVSYQNNSHDAVAAKKKISFQETDHRVKDRSSRRNKNDYSDDHGDDSYDEQQPFRQSIMRQDRNRDDREAPQQQQHRTQASIPGLEHVSSPPKKFMSAVSDMHSGGGSSDRDMKMRYVLHVKFTAVSTLWSDLCGGHPGADGHMDCYCPPSYAYVALTTKSMTIGSSSSTSSCCSSRSMRSSAGRRKSDAMMRTASEGSCRSTISRRSSCSRAQ